MGPVTRRFWPLLIVLFAAGCASVSDGPEQAGTPKAGAGTTTATAPGDARNAAERTGPATSGDSAATVVAPAPPATVWERIRRGYGIPGHSNDRVMAELRNYAGMGAYWERVSERSRPYIHHIVETLDARDMPLELALLPVVESAYRPFAYSHGRAAGLWQFIPATGRHYGLAQNWWYDGRRDVLAATDAALDYLAYLNDMFDGDWLLALAAYNAGEGTVQRAMRRNEAAGRPTDYWSLDLPRETMAYVPRLLAMSELVGNPEAHGINLAAIPNEPAVEVVALDQQIDLALVTELAGVDMETLYALNPGFNRWATAPEGPHRLLLPIDRAEPFRRELARIPRNQWMRWQRHRVANGETLGEIANRYHITVAALQDANAIDGHLIRAGSDLLVPLASRPTDDYALSADARQAATRNQPREGRERRNHIVRAGESFWSIAQRYGVGVRELARWNGMAPGDTLGIGEQLAIWTDAPAAQAGSDRVAIAARSGPGNRLQSVTYTVRQGDSLYRIAQRFRVGIADLRRWNDLPTGGYLQPGQQLRMRVDVTAANTGP